MDVGVLCAPGALAGWPAVLEFLELYLNFFGTVLDLYLKNHTF